MHTLVFFLNINLFTYQKKKENDCEWVYLKKGEERIGGSFYTLIQFMILTEAERKKFVDQFLYTEQELAAAKGREQSLQEQLLKEVDDFQERFRKQIQTQSELEVCLFAFPNRIFMRWIDKSIWFLAFFCL